MKTCYIFSAVPMPLPPLAVHAEDLVIAADAGYLLAKKNGIAPDLVVGDFDSLGEAPAYETIIRHPVDKDDTDTLLAVKIGLERGYRRFEIYGGLGGRLDHTLANLQTLRFLCQSGATGFLLGEQFCVTAVQSDALCFREGITGTVSVFALGEPAYGVTLRGLYYPLLDATLTPDFPVGVSNRFTEEPAEITVKEGLLSVLWNGSPKDILSRNEERRTT